MADGFSLEFNRSNDELSRESALRVLEHLISGTFVCNEYGFGIEEVERRIDEKTMIGFKLGFLGPWLPEWQFIQGQDGNTEVTPLALDVWKAWGDFNQSGFVTVMATHVLENIPVIGQTSTYGKAVKLGVNPLDDPNARSYFRDHGFSHG